MSFSDLSLSPQLQPFFDTALAKAGLRTPTPIQQQAIPPMLDGRDLIAMAQTGSGKTLAYALPLLQQRCLAPDTAPRVLGALVLVPTRELAAQVEDALRQLAAHLPRRLKSVVATGGSSINPQLLALRGGADLVVATPGRLLDLVEHNALRLNGVTTLVLDEADRLLELGFGAELDRILALLPAQRQTVLFSATFPPAIASLAKRRLRDPLRVTIDATPEQAPAIAQCAIAVDAGQRTQLLRHLLQEHAWPQLLVFVASRHSADKVAEKLSKTGIAALPLHGELSQAAANARCAPSNKRTCRCWSPPTWPGAASISTPCRRCSTTICPAHCRLHPSYRPHRTRRCQRRGDQLRHGRQRPAVAADRKTPGSARADQRDRRLRADPGRGARLR